MTEPLIATGLALTIDDLSPFLVEPAIPDGVHNAQRDFSADMSVWDQGLHCVLLWPVIDGAEDLRTLLAQMGIHAAGGFLRQGVTAYLPDGDQEYHLYSGYAVRPRVISYQFFPTNLRVVINNMTRLD